MGLNFDTFFSEVITGIKAPKIQNIGSKDKKLLFFFSIMKNIALRYGTNMHLYYLTKKMCRSVSLLIYSVFREFAWRNLNTSGKQPFYGPGNGKIVN
jgi:hypothetical protein